jgi:Fis family transcriptional regulator
VREQLERLIQEMVDRGVLYEDALRVFERAFIAQVLAHTGGNLSRAADKLGIHRNTLSRKVAEYRLRRR